jgi:hypothetical protein
MESNLGFTCCPNTATDWVEVDGACVEVDRCADNTHFCMSEGYGGLCTWETNVGYTCSCRFGYEGDFIIF